MNQTDLDSHIQAARAQVQASEALVAQQQPTQTDETWWSATNAMTISVAVLVFGIFVLLLAAYLIRIGKSSESVLRIFGTVLIVVVSVFLVVAGYTSTQIAPVMGLLGTIAGYLLGKETTTKTERDQNKEETK
ncbi:MAG TPA: hypothetical protein VMW50_03940 [Dehalococcoidia bacterium]|nr:hypothetical protein [Dehalococcoidia bacterium]